MKSIKYESLFDYFDCKYSEMGGEDNQTQIPDKTYIEEEFKKTIHFDSLFDDKYAVLGIDIYQYSQYVDIQQIAIPFVFQQLLIRTFKVCMITEPFLFQKYKSDSVDSSFNLFLNYFIDTGDGGFIIFETPVHALVFALYFEAIVRNFNSRFIYKKLSKFTDTILLRYAITYDSVYRLENDKFKQLSNHYGAGIINCSRIIAKDRLNRCLIDSETYKWFLYNTNGIETLVSLPFNKLMESREFKDYHVDTENSSLQSFCLPGKRTESQKGIDRVDVLKIGEISSKNTNLSIFNLHVQFSYQLPFKQDNDSKDINYFTVTLGNLNTQGIV